MLARPAPERLTDFYLMFSVGGVVGGILSVLVPPPGVLQRDRVPPHLHGSNSPLWTDDRSDLLRLVRW